MLMNSNRNRWMARWKLLLFNLIKTRRIHFSFSLSLTLFHVHLHICTNFTVHFSFHTTVFIHNRFDFKLHFFRARSICIKMKNIIWIVWGSGKSSIFENLLLVSKAMINVGITDKSPRSMRAEVKKFKFIKIALIYFKFTESFEYKFWATRT